MPTIPSPPGWPRSGRERAGVAMLGIVAGLDGIGFAVALATVLFTGSLASGLEVATGSALLCTAILAVTIGLRSREATNIGQVQDVPVAILATMLASSDVSVPTAFAVIALSSLLTGLLLWATGRFRLGRIVKYFPQPVLAGFLAGTGWLLLSGGVSAAVGFSPSLSELDDLSAAAMRRLVPAALLAVVLHVVVKRFRHPMALLSFLVASLAAFYGWMALSGTSLASAVADGHLPGGSGGASLQLPFPGLLDEVDWGDVGAAAPTILTTAALCLFAMLMNTAALETATGRDLDVDAELRTTGIANTVVAAVGGPPGYTGLSISVLGDRSGVRHRGAGVVSGSIVLLGFVFANQIVTHIPTFLSAGFIMFLGLELLVSWVGETVRRYSVTESITVAVILGFVVFSGFLEATIAGFVAASVLFAFSYARLPIVRSTASLASITSTRDRPPQETAYLRQVGDSVEVMRLHGYLFFGSTERLVTHVRERLDDAERSPLRALVVDAALVPGIDAASAAAFERVRSLAAQRDVRVLLCGAVPSVVEVLRRCGVAVVPGGGPASDGSRDAIVTFDAIDLALHDIEGWLLSTAPRSDEPSFRERVAGDVDDGRFDALVARMRRTAHDAGEVILRSGEPGDELLIVEHGTVAVMRRTVTGDAARLREMGAGAVVGDIGFILGQGRSADIVALEPTTVLRLSRDELDALDGAEPALFALAHRIISRALAEKVITANLMTDQINR